MKTKIITSLIAIISIIMLGFQYYRNRANVFEEKANALKIQMNSMTEQNNNNIADLQERNEEVKKNNEEKNILQQKNDKIRQSNTDKCFNSLLSNDVLQLLKDNGIK